MFPFLNLVGWNVLTVRPPNLAKTPYVSVLEALTSSLTPLSRGLKYELSCVLNIRWVSPQIPSTQWSKNMAQYYE